MYRPFYPQRPGGTSQQHLTGALGLDAVSLLRACERKTPTRNAACMLFWTLGGNQVGKAAISGWQEVVKPALPGVGLWPFDGSLAQLCAHHDLVLAETYPGDAYAQLGLRTGRRWSKRRQPDRAAAGQQLLQAQGHRPLKLTRALAEAIASGFGPQASGEDPFDAMIGLFAMLEVVDGRRPDAPELRHTQRQWEGWILGQA